MSSMQQDMDIDMDKDKDDGKEEHGDGTQLHGMGVASMFKHAMHLPESLRGGVTSAEKRLSSMGAHELEAHPASDVDFGSSRTCDGVGGALRLVAPGGGDDDAACTAHETTRDSFVAFAAVDFICMETDGFTTIHVSRRGPCKEATTVGWHTINFSVSPSSYKAQQGEVAFAPGVREVSFDIVIHDDPAWNPETIMFVELDEPSGNAELGGDLRRATVVVLNFETFPRSLPVETLEKRGAEWAVIKSFMLHNYAGLRRATHKGLLLKLYPGIRFVVNQYIILFLVSMFTECLADHPEDGCLEGTRMDQLTTVGCAWVTNFALHHWCDYEFRRLKLSGQATMALRSSVLNQVIHIAEDKSFSTGMIESILETQVVHAIERTWAAAFKLAGSLFQLAGQVAFTLYIVGTQVENTEVRLLIILMPFTLALYNALLLVVRVRQQSKLRQDDMETADNWSDFVVEHMDLRFLVSNYRREKDVILDFEDLHQASNAASFAAGQYIAATQFASEWLPTMMLLTIVLFGGRLVMSGDRPEAITIGSFLAAFNTASAFGPTMSSIFLLFFQVGEGSASIRKIAEVLNADTRHKQRYLIERREAPVRAQFLRENPDWNQDNLLLRGVQYYHTREECNLRVAALPQPLSVEIEPGQIVAITADGGFGKHTLCRLLTRSLYPAEGFIHLPEDWRVRLVDGVPRMLNASLMENLRWGMRHNHPEDEVWRLCERVGLSAAIMRRPTLAVGLQGERLSFSDRACVAIVRALLSSVDLLLLSNQVLDALGETHALRVLAVLRDFVLLRGPPCLDDENEATPTHARKKKTVIITTKLACVEREADAVIHFPNERAGEGHATCETGPAAPGLESAAGFLCYDASTSRSPKRV